jgi:plastocyanin
MSIAGRRVPSAAVVLVALLLVAGAMIPAMSSTGAREIRLVARGMAFYLEEDPRTPNPTIALRPGETVRIVLRNEERGLLHDFAIPALAAGLDPLAWSERGEVVITAPQRPGSYEYLCRPHRPMMRGTITVVP